MFYDEEMILDLRLNYLNNYVDKFVIVESSYTHSGKKRKLLFDIKKYENFKDKISYIILNDQPKDLFEINQKDSFDKKNSKYILNALKRENLQRNTILKGLKEASVDDIIIISDVDEIPNLQENNLKEIKNKIILFKQKFYYYKFNLKLESFDWHGTKACKKKDLISPQWLRNIKDKKYSVWRFDTLFSKKKYQDIVFLENGGWHFSNMKSPEEIEKKMTTYLHHREYDVNPLGKEKIKEIMKNKKSIYNLKTDMKKDKFDGAQDLVVSDIKELPIYIQNNKNKYKEWLE
jgi:beta-1,4-mannosyl-glycoprotein beta-1,4-N-acetylglucosaminyltransferase